MVPPLGAGFGPLLGIEVRMTRRACLLLMFVLVSAGGCMRPFSLPWHKSACPPLETTWVESEPPRDFRPKSPPEEAPPPRPVREQTPADPTDFPRPLPSDAKSPKRAPPRAQQNSSQGSVLGAPVHGVKITSVMDSAEPQSMPPAQADSALQPATAKSVTPLKKEPLLEALRCVLENRHDEAFEHLKIYDQATQELFIRLLPPMVQLSRKSVEQLSAAEVAMLYTQLESLVVTLRPRAELVIGTMCFIESWKSFGSYKALSKDHAFHAGTPTQPGEQVQIYVELYNFCSECREPFHETRLSSSVELTDANGQKIVILPERKETLRSQSRMHDYFYVPVFYVPNLAPGNYTLTLQVTDETRADQRRVTRKSLPFVVTNPEPR
jgi:hypothetical protein